jgi:microcystin-dependent protein
MAEVYLGQVMLTGFGFAPKGFAACNGQLLPINQYQALFSLLGTQFGGDGRTNFALPNLQGATPVGAGNSNDPNWRPSPYAIGETGGVENVTLQPQSMPSHVHGAMGTSAAGSVKNPANALYGNTGSEPIYAVPGTQALLNAQTLASAGGSQPHPNMQPFRVVNFNIALTGFFPSRS